jgi:hypothetical protein
MRAYLAALQTDTPRCGLPRNARRLKGKLHLVQRSLESRERNGAKDYAAFVARDFRLVSPDICDQTAATVRSSEIGMRQVWLGHRLRAACYFFVVLTRPKMSRRGYTSPKALNFIARWKTSRLGSTGTAE